MDVMVAKKLERELPNSEAFYTEYWRSGKIVTHVLLSWFFDGAPEELEFDHRPPDQREEA